MNVPIYQALSRRILIGYVPRKIAILFWTVSAALILGLHSFYLTPLLAVVFAALILIYRHDSFFLEIIVRNIRQPDYYHP